MAIAAAALGAKVIEKHFTLDKNLPGPDHRASLEPVDLELMVSAIRKIESALGSDQKSAHRAKRRMSHWSENQSWPRNPLKRGRPLLSKT